MIEISNLLTTNEECRLSQLYILNMQNVLRIATQITLLVNATVKGVLV